MCPKCVTNTFQKAYYGPKRVANIVQNMLFTMSKKCCKHCFESHNPASLVEEDLGCLRERASRSHFVMNFSSPYTFCFGFLRYEEERWKSGVVWEMVEVGVEMVEVGVEMVEVGVEMVEVGVEMVEVGVEMVEVGVEMVEVGVETDNIVMLGGSLRRLAKCDGSKSSKCRSAKFRILGSGSFRSGCTAHCVG